MKRFFLALTILTAGATAFWGFRSSAARCREELSERRNAWVAENQLLERIRQQHTEWTTRVHELKQSILKYSPSGAPSSALALLRATNGWNHLPPEARESLLAELGFDWNSGRDYVVLSKDSLPRLSLEATSTNRLTDAASSLLALTPQERATIDSLRAGALEEFKDWAVGHVQRSEPAGNILAKYTMPFDKQFSQNLTNKFVTGVIAALGAERGALMLGYTSSDLSDLGLRGSGPTVLTIKRPAAGQQGIPFELKMSDGGTMYTEISPYQPMPGAFYPVFPGGWADVAAREGFALPKSFKAR